MENVVFLSSPAPFLFEDMISLCSPGWSPVRPRAQPPKSCDYRYCTSLYLCFKYESTPQAKLNRIQFRKILLEQKSSQEHILPPHPRPPPNQGPQTLYSIYMYLHQ